MGLTIVVASTPALGIGFNGTLPWRLKAEMAMFKRITTEAPTGLTNAVVMGRKCWESIPAKFRPLPGRLNVVLSRKQQQRVDVDKTVIYATSFDDALQRIHASRERVHRVFVIGGSHVYAEALKHSQTRTVLWTLVHHDFACDTYLPEFRIDQGGFFTKSSHEAYEAWLGKSVPQGRQQGENGVEFEYTMWVKR